ncbi:MAG TPA: PLP-dependent aminotransferase family protein [Paracoccaceae bacterium]|nr:PLP-dependent aminotransferase family protein [Paracoccaceae bacterium]
MITSWNPDLSGRGGPKYRALAEALRSDVRDGRLAPGTRLPPVRELAWALKVTPGTVARAYQLATDSGLLEATVGRGTFVRGGPAGEAEPGRRLLMHDVTGAATDLLVSRAVDIGQNAIIAEHVAALAAEGLDFTRYASEATDLMGCREAAMDWLSGRGLAGSVEDLVLTEGAQSSLFGALQLVLEGRDTAVVTDELAYPGFRRAIRACRARMVPVASDAEGLIPEAVEEACARHTVKALLLSANAHNPTAVRMGMARREALAEIARRYDIAIVEDDVFGLALPSRLPGFDRLCPERAWIATSLSKCVAAGLRVGFLICPPGRGSAAPRLLRSIAALSSLLLVGLVERLIRMGDAERIVAQVLAENERRREAALEIFEGRPLATQPGLSFVWLTLPRAWPATAFVAAAERVGCLVAGSDSFARAGRPAPNAVRLALSGPGQRAELTAALERIAALLRGPAPELVA